MRAQEQDRPDVKEARQAWGQRLATVAPRHPVFLDECGLTTRLLRLFARAQGGQRAYDSTPYGHYQTFTAFGGLRADGTTAVMTLEGACDADSFLAYVEEVLAPSLGAGDVVVLDNLSSHKDPRVQARIEAAGARVEFLPPYSPDFNPIEKLWSKLKAYLRKARARTEEELLNALKEALALVTENDAKGWFQSCGYLRIQS